MMQDDRRDESNRWLDQQYDRAEEERRRAARTLSDYQAILDKKPSRLRENAGMDPPRQDTGTASGDLFDAVLAVHRQLLRDASDAALFGRIVQLNFSRAAECQAEIADLCRTTENDGSALAAGLRRLRETYRAYARKANGPRLIER